MDSEKAAMIENSEEDVEEVEEEEESDKLSKEKLSAAVLRNPQVMAALQARLDSMVGDPSGYIKVHVNFYRSSRKSCVHFNLFDCVDVVFS